MLRAFVAILLLAGTGCSGVEYFAANAPTALGSYDRTVDLPFGEGKRQRLDIYAPRHATGRPVVIFWYGGSWLTGRKSNYRFVGAALAQRGFVTVVPDYRLYPEVKFPALLEDPARAVAWVQQHAQEFGGDPRRIVLMGHSAGAHMAAFMAYDRALLEKAGARPEWIKGFIGLSGPYALDPNSDILRKIFANPYTVADWQPVRFVDAHSVPSLLFHGTQDSVVEVAHTERLRDALLSQHAQVQARIVFGRGHADTVAAFALGARHRVPVLTDSVRFIESVTGPGAASASPSTQNGPSP